MAGTIHKAGGASDRRPRNLPTAPMIGVAMNVRACRLMSASLA
jgi:hypothetical protein